MFIVVPHWNFVCTSLHPYAFCMPCSSPLSWLYRSNNTCREVHIMNFPNNSDTHSIYGYRIPNSNSEFRPNQSILRFRCFSQSPLHTNLRIHNEASSYYSPLKQLFTNSFNLRLYLMLIRRLNSPPPSRKRTLKFDKLKKIICVKISRYLCCPFFLHVVIWRDI